ncbi:hypothetical protein MHH33_07010 [Paenisporosarcina sp. FSL H8-0542]|uniref:hypothetical protein n=1 Tax=Paenisporosarcina sp. FSL H8-0542 TaxID=2921401 RepID=UPI00315A093C
MTKYHEKLVIGTEGNAIGVFGPYSRGNDMFITVDFKFKQLDVNWSGLEIIDEKYLAGKRKLNKGLKKAKDIVLTVGPAGGFQNLKFNYKDEKGAEVRFETWTKNEGLEVLKSLEELGKKIKKDINETDVQKQRRLEREAKKKATEKKKAAKKKKENPKP